ncbi:MAG: hypothetical protein H6714_00605 [Myxococcales bacterium]|nr:hypothetical protein [Myxococcales bacterium]
MSDTEQMLVTLLDRVQRRKRGTMSDEDHVPEEPTRAATMVHASLEPDIEMVEEDELDDPFSDASFKEEMPSADTAVRQVPFVTEASASRHEAVRPKSIAPPSIPIARVVSEARLEGSLTFGQLIKHTLSLRPK